MNPTEEIVYVTLNGHRWMKAYEERENVWKDGCSCFWSGDDWYEHASQEVVKALMPAPQPVPAGVIQGRSWEQLPMPGLEPEVPRYKGINL
jgi:hypothetical protein